MIFLLSLFYAAQAFSVTSNSFPPELREFLGPPPAIYSKVLFPEAKSLAKSLLKKDEPGLKKLAETSEFSDYAQFVLGQSYASKKLYAKSLESFDRLLLEHPHSALADIAKPLRTDTILSLGQLAAKKGQKKFAQKMLIRGLDLLAWKDWEEHEDAVKALLDLLDPDAVLYDAYLGETLLALPSDSALRMELTQDLSSEEIHALTNLAKYHGVAGQAGVKPTSPDNDLFDEAMALMLHRKWEDALPLLEKLESTYPQTENLDRSRYWHARCLREKGKLDESNKLFQEIWESNPFSYHGLQSAEILGKDPMEIAKNSKPTNWPEFDGAMLPRQLMGVWKIRALLENGLIDFARLEAENLFAYRPSAAIFGQNNASGAMAVASFFAAAGLHGAAFTEAYAAMSLDPSLVSPYGLSLLFPNAFHQEVQSASDLTGINPLLIQSLTKQESAFDPNALSHSDAYGLMQLLPGTARSIGEVPRRRDLFQPQLNTELGAQYLKKLLDRFNGNIALALAAYNAGPTRAAGWQKGLETSELFKDGFAVDAFIDAIPFQETRKYVASILRNYTWYKLLNKDGSLIPIQELAFQWQKNPPPLQTKPEKVPNQSPNQQ